MDEDINEENLIEFEDILLEALEFAQQLDQPQWQGFLITMLTAIRENLEDEFATLCSSFLRKTAQDKKENQEEELMSFHFVVNRIGNT